MARGVDTQAVDGLWRQRALCKAKPDDWFPASWSEKAAAAHQCRKHCPVFAECEEALRSDELRGVSPVGGVQAAVCFNEHGKRAEWQPLAPRCRGCLGSMTAEQMAQAERDIEQYTLVKTGRAARKGEVQAHRETIVAMAREGLTDRVIAERLGVGSAAAVGRVRKQEYRRRKGWHEGSAA